MNFDDLKTAVLEAGIVGAGGAGFPTYMKLNEAADTLVINAAECEPLLRVDRQLLAIYAEEIIDILKELTDILKVKAIIAIKGEYKKAIKALEGALIGCHNIKLKLLKNVYPAGDELVTVYEATGRIVAEGAIPLSVGVIVLNVETLLNIYNKIKLEKNVTEKYVTITGTVNNPITLKAKLGTSFKELIDLAGGSNIDEYEILNGGPMTGRIVEDDATITKTTKAIIVLPKEHKVIKKKTINSSIILKRAMSVCSQCRMCTDLCPRNLLGHNLEPNKLMRALCNGIEDDIEAYTQTMLCSECGLCEMYSCHQGLSPRLLIKEVKNRLREQGVKNPHKNKPEHTKLMREYRMIPMDRLIERLGLSQYLDDAPLTHIDYLPKRVKVSLKQGLGMSSKAIVKPGDKVLQNQLIAEVQEGKLGSKIHSSIDGIVEDVNESNIVIISR